jgi:hypothetical protein
MRRTSLLLTLGLAAAVLASACAKGAEEATSELDSTTAQPDGGDAAPGACATPCAEGEACSAGQCVPGSTDWDHDGAPAATDCDDHDGSVHPGAAETCNGKDDDCDGAIDDGFDLDADGAASCAVGTKPADCDDADPAVYPGAAEACNGVDDDCDGTVDEGFDADNDGFYACDHGALAADCNDSDATVHPGATEVCDAKDDDCDGQIDEVPASLAGSLVAPADAHWVVTGAAVFASPWVTLTPDLADQAGALWWNATYTFDTFDVAATFWIPVKDDGADGMAFAWVPGAALQAGGGATGFGVGGLGGWAVAIDTFQNTGEPAVPYLAIMDTTGAQISRSTIPNVRDSMNHVLRVRLEAGKVSVWIDAVSYLFEYPLPGYVPFAGHWGFGAATGGASEAHWIRDVAMSFPNGQGCVP